MKKFLLIKLCEFALFLMRKNLERVELMDIKGNMYKPMNPERKKLDLEIIALTLAGKFRFVHGPMSVARHCINMARIFMAEGKTRLAMQALLHEISEAYMGDWATPFKKAFPIFKMLENIINENTFIAYDIGYPVDDEVNTLDKQIMVNEALSFMPNPAHWLAMGDGVHPERLNVSGVSFEDKTMQEDIEDFIAVAIELGLHVPSNEIAA